MFNVFFITSSQPVVKLKKMDDLHVHPLDEKDQMQNLLHHSMTKVYTKYWGNFSRTESCLLLILRLKWNNNKKPATYWRALN
ncbi:hypothetical protein CGZ90_15145 [Fictibacillus aquaticus]|uniref:Uncharacterized protein n=1 Tax=Fictibacillus aquaticus TaxID=2021314 RepID=A0A235F6P2_9BACL|nr:hypothetical protein CGZ90_15145 [Fictibacillus aquaticus]